MVYQPTHHRAQQNGYVREHLLIAEAALGKPLPRTAHVHHYGHISDNTKLVICQDAGYHHLLHQLTAALKATGNRRARVCAVCGRYGDPTNPRDKMTVRRVAGRPSGNGQAYHRACAAKYVRSRRK